MDDTPDIGLLNINSQVGLGWDLVWVVNTSEALDLATAGLLVDAAFVGLLGVFEAGSDMHEVEIAVLLGELSRVLASGLEWGDWCGDNGGTGAGELRGDKADTANVLVTVLLGEAKLGRELVADGLA